jgi:hypothetical protein
MSNITESTDGVALDSWCTDLSIERVAIELRWRCVELLVMKVSNSRFV